MYYEEMRNSKDWRVGEKKCNLEDTCRIRATLNRHVAFV